MKINNNAVTEIIDPEVLVDVNGNIMFFNEKARKEFKLKIKNDISNLINIDDIRKFSMFSSKADIINTLHSEYKYALIYSSGDALNKVIRLIFKANIGKTEEILKVEKNILSVVNNVDLNKRILNISMNELSSKIKAITQAKGYYLNTYIKIDEPICVNESNLQALIMCAIAMMNETSPKRPVDLYIKRDLNNLIEIKIIVRVDTTEEKRTPQGVELIYPWTSIRIALIDKICEDNGIKYNISVTEKSLKVVYKIKEEQLSHTSVHSGILGGLNLEALYDMLLPREDIYLSYIEK